MLNLGVWHFNTIFICFHYTIDLYASAKVNNRYPISVSY